MAYNITRYCGVKNILQQECVYIKEYSFLKEIPKRIKGIGLPTTYIPKDNSIPTRSNKERSKHSIGFSAKH